MRALRLVTLAPVLVAPAADADRLDVGDYGPADKLGRGLANMVTGVLALPGSIAEGAHDNGAAGAAGGVGGCYMMRRHDGQTLRLHRTQRTGPASLSAGWRDPVSQRRPGRRSAAARHTVPQPTATPPRTPRESPVITRPAKGSPRSVIRRASLWAAPCVVGTGASAPSRVTLRGATRVPSSA